MNRIADVDDSVVENFGWPCYEGPGPPAGGYAAADLPVCEALYNTPGAATGPYTSYRHTENLVTGCETGGSSVSGLAFYQGGTYPAGYAGALFLADYARNCIWMMLAGSNGLPSPTKRHLFAQASSPVALEIGPGGDLFYVSYWEGTVRRIVHVENRTPTAHIAANPTGGPSPLTVEFDGQGSVDPDAAEILSYAWDLDGDGVFDDGTEPTASWTYTAGGVYTPALKVTDRADASNTATTTVIVDNSYPEITLDAPSPDLEWSVGDTIAFSARASDAQDGDLPETALSWSLVLAHCSSSGCHDHGLESFPGTASGSFVTPDHEYPSHLRLVVTATDSSDLSSSATVILQPKTFDVTFASSPSGIELSVGGTTDPSPFTRQVIADGEASIAAPATVVRDAITYDFVSWSDGGGAATSSRSIRRAPTRRRTNHDDRASPTTRASTPQRRRAASIVTHDGVTPSPRSCYSASASAFTVRESASSSAGVPIAMSTWPGWIDVSGDGFVLNRPSSSRSARTNAPVRSRRSASRMLRPAIDDCAGTRISSNRNCRPRSCMTTSRNSVTFGCSTNAAIRAPPMLCGLTTRSAPARRSFSSVSSTRARATMKRSGRRERALRVTKRLPASVLSAATKARARPSPAAFQHAVFRRVADDRGHFAVREARGVDVDDHHVGPRGREFLTDGAADAPPAAQDDVRTHCCDPAVHPTPPEELREVALEEHLEHHTERVQRRADADEDEHDREHLAGRVERLHFAKAHRRNGRDRLVQRVEPREPEHDVADRPDHEDAGEQGQREAQSPPVEHRVSMAHTGRERSDDGGASRLGV